MQVSLEPIYHPLQRDRVSNTSKWVVINNGDASQIIKILVATTYRSFRSIFHFTYNNDLEEYEAIRTPDRNLHQAHLVITTDILLREFNVIKNRYGSDRNGSMTPDYFLNTYLKRVIGEMGYTNQYEVSLIMHGIIGALSFVTGEPIQFVNGKYKTMRDLYYEKNLIRYKQLKHNFLDARIS